MKQLFAIAVALASVAGISAQAQDESPHQISIQRPENDFTIYLVSGDLDKLTAFHEQFGSSWEGGELLKADRETGTYHYLAYAWRTASQSRSFMMPSIFSGLDLQIESYNDDKYFPELRSKLDEKLIECGLLVDPFLIISKTQVSFTPRIEDTDGSTRCIFDFVMSGAFGEEVSFGFFGNGPAEEVEEQ